MDIFLRYYMNGDRCKGDKILHEFRRYGCVTAVPPARTSGLLFYMDCKGNLRNCRADSPFATFLLNHWQPLRETDERAKKKRTDCRPEVLNRLMLDRHLGPAALARLVGAKPNTVSHWRNGRSIPNTEKLARLYEVFGSDIFKAYPHNEL